MHRSAVNGMLDRASDSEELLCVLWNSGWLYVLFRDGSKYHRLGKVDASGRFEPYPDTTLKQQLDHLYEKPLDDEAQS